MRNLLILFILLFYGNIHAQHNMKKESIFSTLKDSTLSIESFLLYNSEVFIGLSVGSESVIGFPKFGMRTNLYSKDKFRWHAGVEASGFIFFQLWFNINAQTGIEYRFLSLETSVGAFCAPFGGSTTDLPIYHTTFTPKIGIRIKSIQFKLGNAFVFNQNYPEGDLLQLNRNQYNFNIDILYVGSLVF